MFKKISSSALGLAARPRPFTGKAGAASAAELERLRAELATLKAAVETARLARTENISRLVHELRSPLNAILGFAQLLESGPAPQTALQKENTGEILRAGYSMMECINQLLERTQDGTLDRAGSGADAKTGESQ